MSKIIFVLTVLAYSSIDVGDFIFKIHIEDKYIECTRSVQRGNDDNIRVY